MTLYAGDNVGQCADQKNLGGVGGIRTHGTIAGPPPFQGGTISRALPRHRKGLSALSYFAAEAFLAGAEAALAGAFAAEALTIGAEATSEAFATGAAPACEAAKETVEAANSNAKRMERIMMTSLVCYSNELFIAAHH